MFAHESPAVWLGHGYLQLVAATNSRLADAVAEGIAEGELLGQVGQPDETRQAITFLIVCLVGIAVLLGVLTIWYWQFTSPKRRAKSLLSDLGHYEADQTGAPSTEVPVPTEVLVPAEVASSVIIESKSNKQTTGLSTPVPSEDSESSPAAPIAKPGPPLDEAPAPARMPTSSEPTVPPTALPAAASVAPPMMPPASNRPLRSNPSDRNRAAAKTGQRTQAKSQSPKSVPVGPSRIEVADRRRPPSDNTPIFPKREQNPAAATITQRGPLQAPAAASRRPKPATKDRTADDPMRPPSQQNTGDMTGQEGLSDDDWAAVMQSAFSKLKQ